MIYVNGGTYASSFKGSFTGAAPVVSIGRWQAGTQHFLGSIDEVALYPTALSFSRVNAHYQAGTTATASTNTFVYNADGALVAKQVNGTATAHYLAGGLGERDPSTLVTKKYYRFGGRLVAVRDSASGLHYLHQDHLGSTSLQTTPAGAYEGHDFRGPFGQPWRGGGALATDLKYTEQRSFEAGLGSLVHYGARYRVVPGTFRDSALERVRTAPFTGSTVHWKARHRPAAPRQAVTGAPLTTRGARGARDPRAWQGSRWHQGNRNVPTASPNTAGSTTSHTRCVSPRRRPCP